MPHDLRRRFFCFLSTVLLLAAVMAVESFSQQSIVPSVYAAQPIVQWRNDTPNNSNDSGVSVMRDLRWRKPESSVGSDSVVRSSQGVVPLPELTTPIRLVQHTEPAMSSLVAQNTPITTAPTPTLPGMPPAKPVDPAVQEHIIRNIPSATPNPPSGSTSTPLSVEPKRTESWAKPSAASDTPATTTNTTTKPSKPVVSKPATVQPDQDRYIKDIPAVKPDTPLVEPIPSTVDVGVEPTGFDARGTGGTGKRQHDCKAVTFKPITSISCDIKPRPITLPRECPLESEPYIGRHFSQTCFQWKASAVCTKAAYFENVKLSRYGHSVCPTLEPIISGAKFFTTIPLLPYKAGLTPPNECVYTLGHYRVGNCAPQTLDPLPISVRAILFEGAAVAGAIAIIP
jgi:hypothetical protein